MTALQDLLEQAQTVAATEAAELTDAKTALATTQAALADAQTALAAVQKSDTATLFGVDGEPLDTASYPRTLYCREYNRPGRGIKPLAAPASVTLPHPSFHDLPTAALVNPWLDRLHRPVIFEHGHEPEGDTTTDIYRGAVQRLLDLVAAHPNGHLVTVAQTFTRYAQVHGKNMTDGKPATWQNLWVEGSGLIGFDCEVDSSIHGYPDPAAFFAPAVTASQQLGVPFIIPELGWPLQATDTDGTGLAAWYVACAAYLRSTGRCAAVAAFNLLGTTGDYRLTGPAKAAWQTVVASQ